MKHRGVFYLQCFILSKCCYYLSAMSPFGEFVLEQDYKRLACSLIVLYTEKYKKLHEAFCQENISIKTVCYRGSGIKRHVLKTKSDYKIMLDACFVFYSRSSVDK